MKRWSIRGKITAMLAVPLVMLVLLWGFSVSLTLPSALELRGANLVSDRAGKPAEAMVEQIQVERQLTMLYMAGSKRNVADVNAQRSRTDAAIAAFQRLSSGEDVRDEASEEALDAISATNKALESVATLRASADRGGSTAQVRQGYTGIVTAAYTILEAVTNHQDPEVSEEALSLFVLSMSRDLFSQEDALVTELLAAGQLNQSLISELVSLLGQKRLILPYAATLLPEESLPGYQAVTSGAAFGKLSALENALLTGGPTAAALQGFDLVAWRAVFDPVNTELKEFRQTVQAHTTEHAGEVADGILLRLAVAGLAGLIAVVLALVLSVRIGRSLARRLDGLRSAALDLADQRLPGVVARLRQGQAVDLAAEAPPLELGADEIGQVADAFNSVQRTALASAVEEASVRQGMNEVFLNIARRSQTLLHRQLSLLDGMERRSTEPDDLADLFRVDHLATRMRRHAEDLVILAGAAPGRGWRNPVPMIDVIRGAVSEVEDYARVQVQAISDAAVVGRAVGDVIHMLAELLENATAYSPPHTRVHVNGQVVPNGFVVEIEDRGLGMPAEQLAEANRRLATPPDFDPANSSRLGLFVVAQLAARHGVSVVLRPSPYGGVTAVALLPADLVVARSAGQPALTESAARSVEAPAVVSERQPAGRFTWLGESTERRQVAAESVAARDVDATQVLPASSLRRSAVDEARRVPEPRPGMPVDEPRRLHAVPAVREAAVDAGGFDVDGPGVRWPVGQARVDGPGDGGGGFGGPEPSVVRPAEEPGARHARGGGRGLPKRVRQQSLAPQLQRPETGPVPAPEEIEAPSAVRSPEEMRAMMSSFQQGTSRGRHTAAQDSDDNGGVA